MNNVIVWDIEPVPDLGGYAAANGMSGAMDDKVQEAIRAAINPTEDETWTKSCALDLGMQGRESETKKKGSTLRTTRINPSSRGASLRMARVRQKGTGAELNLRRILHARGLRYRLHAPLLTQPRRVADIVFPAARLAVFVDGCFWHGCPEHASWPKSNAEFWRAKIEANRARDADTDVRLKACGWQVVRIWEHEDAGDAADRIVEVVHARKKNGIVVYR